MAARSVVIFIAVWSIFQGLVYGMLSIIALFTFNCKISTESSKASYLMYLVYFRDQRCGSYQWKVISDVPHEPNWPSVTNVAFRTHILFSIYLVLSVLLIVTSFWLVVGCFITCMGRTTYYFFIMPWLLICGSTIVFDVIALANFLYDLFNTLETETFLKYLQIEKTPSVHKAFKDNEAFLWIPSVVMLLIACRGFVFWCLNVVLFNCVAINGKTIAKNAEKIGRSQTRSNYNGSTFSENRFDRSFSPSSGLSGSMKRMPYPTYPCSNSNCQRNWSPLSHSTSYEHSKQLAEAKKEKLRNAPQVKLVSTSSTPANLLIADLANPWRELDTIDSAYRRNHHKHHQNIELIEKPSKLKLLSDSAYKLNDTGSHSTFYPERDLPGRVPWSYKRQRTNNDTSKQKVKFEEFNNDDVLPSVTGPNYKLHFIDREPRANGTVQRTTPAKQFIGSTGRVSDSDGHWSGPEYRY